MRPNDPHIVYGLTGGVGSGKSEILNYISAHYECRVIQADEVGRELMKRGQCVYRALVDAFGESILGPDGEIDRAAFAELLFSDPEALKKANAVEHPLIKRSILMRISHTKCRHIFLEAALLSEGDLIPICKKVIVATADPEIRVERLVTHRGYSEEKARSVMGRQLSDEAFRELADHVIDTGGTLPETYEEVRKLMALLKVPEKK